MPINKNQHYYEDQHHRHNDGFIFLDVADKNKDNLTESKTDNRYENTPRDGVEDAEGKEFTHLQIGTTEKNQDNGPDADKKAYHKDDKISVLPDYFIGEGDFAPNEGESFDDIFSEEPPNREKRAIARKGTGKGVEHNHPYTHVTELGKYPAKQNRCFSFEKGPDEDTNVAVLCYVNFHMSPFPSETFYIDSRTEVNKHL